MIKVEFLNRPFLVPVGNDNAWELTQDFHIRITGDITRDITIPAGFWTDLASVPRLPGAYLLFGGKARRAAILHDWLYEQREDRQTADRIFREAASQEVGYLRKWAMWAAVRVGGAAYYMEAKESSPHPESTREAP